MLTIVNRCMHIYPWRKCARVLLSGPASLEILLTPPNPGSTPHVADSALTYPRRVGDFVPARADPLELVTGQGAVPQ